MPETIIIKKWASNAELNKALRESRDRIAFSEGMFGGSTPVDVRKLTAEEASKVIARIPVAEAAKKTARELFKAKVGQADKMNQNRRIYPREVWQKQIDHYNQLAKEGYLAGAVDHIGMVEGGNLRDTCIMHRELWMEDDGAVYSNFEIVREHSKGKDLGANVDAGMKIGFSTYGYGTGHEPNEGEMARFGCTESDEATVMNVDYDLKKIDSVDDPSVYDARILDGVPAGGGVTERTGSPSIRIAEACSNGLHWKEIGSCGHVLSQCRCESEEKTCVWKSQLCDRCIANPGENLSIDGFKARISENKPKRAAIVESARPPLVKTFQQYVQSKSGDSFEPIGALTTTPELTQDCYDIIPTWHGVRFQRKAIQTDDLYRFSGSVMEKVLAEVDTFWALKPKYDALGVMHNRGIMLEGPPGMGKTCGVNQITEMVISRGDVVFYGNRVSALIEALKAFREIEPDRKVLVALEDADEYIGWQERQMINLLDGAESISGVLYLATTNYINRFPERLLRSGRFDRKIHVGPPPYEGRLAFLTKKLSPLKEKKEEIERLSKDTDGLSFGDLRELVIAIYAIGEGRDAVLSRLKKRIKRGESLDARLEPQTEGAAVTESARPQEDGVKEGAGNHGSDAMTLEQQLAAAQAANKALVDALNPALGKLKEHAGIELPTREVLPAEVAERTTRLETQIRDLIAAAETKANEFKTALAAKDAELATAKAELATEKAKFANIERVKKIQVKATPLLKDNAYAPALKAALIEKLNDAAFDDTKVEAFLESKCGEYDLVSGGKTKGKGKPAPEKAPQRPANGFDPSAMDLSTEEIEEIDNGTAAVESSGPESEPCAELNW